MDGADGGEYNDSEYYRNLYRSQRVIYNTVAQRDIQRGPKKRCQRTFFCFFLRNTLTKSDNFWHT